MIIIIMIIITITMIVVKMVITQTITTIIFLPIRGRVDKASATETVDSASISGRVKPKTIKIGIQLSWLTFSN